MRVCASISSLDDLEHVDNADMVEIRLDLIDKIPIVKGKDLLVTFRGPVDLNILPEKFEGMVDIGEENRPDTALTIVASYHDYEKTPDAERVRSILSSQDSDVSKGAFQVNCLRDLVSIADAAKNFPKRHVVLGMGALGTVTRIRQSLLGNEFSFGYVGEPTAPGQLSVDEMSALNDDCILLGIIGNPVSKSKSPKMQNAAMKAAGINGRYLPFEVDNLDLVEEVIRSYDIRGMNVTIPFKQEIMDHIDVVDKHASSIGAVNTIVNNNGRLEGYNTDVVGIAKALEVADIDPEDGRVLILGSGGAARACAHYMLSRNCDITITGRNRDTGMELAKEFGGEYKHGSSVSVRMYDLIVNCTPIGMYSNGPYPINVSSMDHSQAVFDMVYGASTPLVTEAAHKGCKIAYGIDMLAGQGAASFSMWTGVNDSFDIMRRELQ